VRLYNPRVAARVSVHTRRFTLFAGKYTLFPETALLLQEYDHGTMASATKTASYQRKPCRCKYVTLYYLPKDYLPSSPGNCHSIQSIGTPPRHQDTPDTRPQACAQRVDEGHFRQQSRFRYEEDRLGRGVQDFLRWKTEELMVVTVWLTRG